MNDDEKIYVSGENPKKANCEKSLEMKIKIQNAFAQH